MPHEQDSCSPTEVSVSKVFESGHSSQSKRYLLVPKVRPRMEKERIVSLHNSIFIIGAIITAACMFIVGHSSRVSQ